MQPRDSPSKHLQIWIHITQALISAGHGVDLHRAFNRAYDNSYEYQDQSCDPEDSQTATLFGTNLDKLIGEIQQPEMLDCPSSPVSQKSLRTDTNKP